MTVQGYWSCSLERTWWQAWLLPSGPACWTLDPLGRWAANQGLWHHPWVPQMIEMQDFKSNILASSRQKYFMLVDFFIDYECQNIICCLQLFSLIIIFILLCAFDKEQHFLIIVSSVLTHIAQVEQGMLGF